MTEPKTEWRPGPQAAASSTSTLRACSRPSRGDRAGRCGPMFAHRAQRRGRPLQQSSSGASNSQPALALALARSPFSLALSLSPPPQPFLSLFLLPAPSLCLSAPSLSLPLSPSLSMLMYRSILLISIRALTAQIKSRCCSAAAVGCADSARRIRPSLGEAHGGAPCARLRPGLVAGRPPALSLGGRRPGESTSAQEGRRPATRDAAADCARWIRLGRGAVHISTAVEDRSVAAAPTRPKPRARGGSLRTRAGDLLARPGRARKRSDIERALGAVPLP